ncbi:hypothetical protein JCM19232_1535 [Vibrio ishigakensis]|uniref:Uncharacterized protein n=1 Tax=Vibrio ishigakensis TaxID=1481914 RepID=A0A0B8PJW3_9VIBR|nr:hypothetical protein JCM19232_1535 [Vibrio ishigakensis]
MNTSYIKSIQDILKVLDVDAGIQNFTNEWLASNPVVESSDLFELLDRLMIPYEVHPASKKLAKIEHQIAVLLPTTR